MDENEQLTKLLKPVVAMREQWFGVPHETYIPFPVQESAQRLDYLLGATIAAYHSVIQKSENDPDINLSEWHCRYKPIDSEVVSFYIGCWELDKLVEMLCRESKRTAEKIRTTLHRELMLKQLELCRLMVNYSREGDIWSRTFSAALSLIDLLDFDEEFDGDVSIRLTHLAQWICIHHDDEGNDYEFSYPRFKSIKNEYQTMFTQLGVGIDAALYVDGDIPRGLNVNGSLVAIYDEDSEEIITIRYMTSSGIFYREKGFWWNYGHDVEDFFDDLEMLYVKPEFVERFDLDEEHGHRVKLDELTPYALSYEEIFPND
jgi:hypothetical protein